MVTCVFVANSQWGSECTVTMQECTLLNYA